MCQMKLLETVRFFTIPNREIHFIGHDGCLVGRWIAGWRR